MPSNILCEKLTPLNLSENEHLKDIAYFTTSSGTSGEVKCAMIAKKGLFQLMEYQSKQFQIEIGKRVLQVANPGFDAIIAEVFVTLYSGATLEVLQADNYHVIPAIIKQLESKKIHLITLTPSVASKIYSSLLKTLDTLVLVREKASYALVKKIFGKTRLINAYGPCEVTVCSHMYEIDHPKKYACIGYCVPYLSFKVVDESGISVNNGESGELLLYGDAVTLGYIGEKNLDNTLEYNTFTNDHTYKTGDYVRLNADDTLTYQGRIDRRVKVRGQKVNLNEIENCLNKHPLIKFSYAFLFDHHLSLIYQGEVDELDIRNYLQQHLHLAVIPTNIHSLWDIPFNLNGKIDEKRLKVFIATKHSADTKNTQLENVTTSIFKNVLQVNHINKKDDFFNIGGDSLKLVDLMSQFSRQTGKDLDLDKFLEKPTLEKFIELFDKTEKCVDFDKDLREKINVITKKKAQKQFIFQKNKQVILTGVTGRVGFSILLNLLKHKNITVYCIGRGNKEQFYKRLLATEFEYNS